MLRYLVALGVLTSTWAVPICPAVDGQNAVYFPDETDCSKFFECSNGIPYSFDCPSGLDYNPILNVCDWPSEAGCQNKSYTTSGPFPSTKTTRSTERSPSTRKPAPTGKSLPTEKPWPTRKPWPTKKPWPTRKPLPTWKPWLTLKPWKTWPIWKYWPSRKHWPVPVCPLGFLHFKFIPICCRNVLSSN